MIKLRVNLATSQYGFLLLPLAEINQKTNLILPDKIAGNTICVQGATCEFFLTCWISGGLIDNQCDGLLKVCCYRGVAKQGTLGQSPAIGTIEAPPELPRARDVALFDNVRKSFCFFFSWNGMMMFCGHSVYSSSSCFALGCKVSDVARFTVKEHCTYPYYSVAI